MEIKVGDKVRVNEKGMATDSLDNDWLWINPNLVDQVKRMEYLTVTSFASSGNIHVREAYGTWPIQLFEKVEEGLEVSLTDQDREVLINLLQSQVGIYTRLIEKLK